MPQAMRRREALGRIWMPAPISPMAEADSRTVTEWPARAMAMAAASPPRPAPTMIVCGVRGVLGRGLRGVPLAGLATCSWL